MLDNERQYSIGISVLDTRKIQTHNKSIVQDKWHQHTVQAFQFTAGQGKYANKARRQYLFGEAKLIIVSELKAEVDAIVQSREYSLVFHGRHEDMTVIQQLNIGQQALCILDTVRASQFPLQLHFRLSLERLLDLLGIPFHNLQAAGNDAHFVLKALLLLAVEDSRTQHVVPNKDVLEVLMGFEDIAQSPVPAPKPKPTQKPPRIKQPKHLKRRI